MAESIQHQLHYRIRMKEGSDTQAPGGAVTVALCGHWEHKGNCRWPHLSTIALTEKHHLLTITIQATHSDLPIVQGKIETALLTGRLIGPDDRLSLWTLIQ